MFFIWLTVCWPNNTHIVRGWVKTWFWTKWLYVVPPQPPPPPLISQPNFERIVESLPLLPLLVVKWSWFFAFHLVCLLHSFCFGFGSNINHRAFSGVSVVKNLPANAGNAGLIPGLGRFPGEGNGNPVQYSCLGNPWTEEPGGLQSIGSQRVRHSLATKCEHKT